MNVALLNTVFTASVTNRHFSWMSRFPSPAHCRRLRPFVLFPKWLIGPANLNLSEALRQDRLPRIPVALLMAAVAVEAKSILVASGTPSDHRIRRSSAERCWLRVCNDLCISSSRWLPCISLIACSQQPRVRVVLSQTLLRAGARARLVGKSS